MEHPILFKPEMVQAIMSGIKTQTRRSVPEKILDAYYNYDDWVNSVGKPEGSVRVYEKEYFLNACRYELGDILWVRETWGELYDTCDHPEISGGYKERSSLGYVYKADNYVHNKDFDGFFTGWKPSIHMPKQACRLFLRVTDIRVEKLREITEDDAIAEGVEKLMLDVGGHEVNLYKDYEGASTGCHSARTSFGSLWNKINGEVSFFENPWVYVIKFEKLPQNNQT